MTDSNFEKLSVKESYAVYGIDLDNINFIAEDQIEIPASQYLDHEQMLMKLVEAHALIAEVAIQLGVDTSNQEALGMINLLERMTDETAVQFRTLHKDDAEKTVKS